MATEHLIRVYLPGTMSQLAALQERGEIAAPGEAHADRRMGDGGHRHDA